ncbi:MBL fold metallo-hydrolase [Echinimonas agarilytica]|uniref:MBL fold metallo-hydrolase n=1 Tax=Echinimonas agarilytica TaxID=1215918 RepID=A0AA41W6Z6_9GAMM|nr:MBL fold metallo-hydrolase [Echinimonas agarilytica]MCM2680187.1 MBL fold metallo-hydrolase [Echinimonas agarilytica]
MQYHIIPVTPFMQNCSIIWCPETLKAAVVDPGGDMARLNSFIAEKGLTLTKVLLTHAHIDHAGATADMAQQYSIPIEGPHLEDQFWIDGLDQQSRMFGFPKVETFTPTRWLAQDDRVTVGQQELEVRFCPGHTPGHVVFVNHSSKWSIVGDVIFQNSIGRTDFPKGDHATLIDSIQQQIMSLPDDYAILPGHGPKTTVGQERRSNPHLVQDGW